MGKHTATAKKVHLIRIGDELTKCGRKFKTTGPFVNPDAVFCDQCNNLATADGLTVSVTWEADHWRVKANPPLLAIDPWNSRQIINRNDPEAPAVRVPESYLRLLISADIDGIYETYGPQKELTAAE